MRDLVGLFCTLKKTAAKILDLVQRIVGANESHGHLCRQPGKRASVVEARGVKRKYA